MINANLLRGKIAENGYTQERFAEKIGISRHSLNRKIKEKTSFTIDEVNIIAKELDLNKDNIIAIFFNPKIPNSQHNKEPGEQKR